MPYYIDADHIAEYFAALRRNLPHDSKDFLTRDSMLLNAEQIIRGTPHLTCLPWDSFPVGECNGCRWWQNRYQKCSCCRRNRGLKDNYEEATK